jgi:hypothetical protein
MNFTGCSEKYHLSQQEAPILHTLRIPNRIPHNSTYLTIINPSPASLPIAAHHLKYLVLIIVHNGGLTMLQELRVQDYAQGRNIGFGQSAPVTTGSSYPPYAPYFEYYQSISCTPAYRGTSFEVFNPCHGA